MEKIAKTYQRPQILNAEVKRIQPQGVFGALKGAAYMVGRSMAKSGISYREQKLDPLQTPVSAK